ncbi:MAG TPA: phospholipase D-like domain-containing protein [Terriglobia bacterium]|nr:phospholipase D-like domain-containing protein [Terriglobia bacterium]
MVTSCGMERNPPPFRAFNLADEAFSRTSGAELVRGNRVRLLRDGAANYPAWLDAIGAARRWIHLETYMIHDDEVGRQFADLLAKKAAEGVRVRLIYDWFGVFGRTSRRFWKRMTACGVEARCFNPPLLDSPFSWLSRDHRKVLTVDGGIAYVSGLCIGKAWLGYPDRNIDPWRDTGMEIEGPAVVSVDRAFAEAWASLGSPVDAEETDLQSSVAGDVDVRVVASAPSTGGVYRLDQLIATLARRSMWLSDAYFAGTSSYVNALRSAAEAGVDVRMLIPGASDVLGARAISRAGLRPLLESGVRVFEWSGPMMHAKTAVVDSSWARVGSTNLNLSSWIGNWELDVVVENNEFAREMETMFLEDLQRSTEIVLGKGWRRPIATRVPVPRRRRRSLREKTSGAGRAAAGVLRFGRTVEAAITRRRELGPAEAVVMLWGAGLLIGAAIITVIWPDIFHVTFLVLCLWIALSLIVQTIRLFIKGRRNSR